MRDSLQGIGKGAALHEDREDEMALYFDGAGNHEGCRTVGERKRSWQGNDVENVMAML